MLVCSLYALKRNQKNQRQKKKKEKEKNDRKILCCHSLPFPTIDNSKPLLQKKREQYSHGLDFVSPTRHHQIFSIYSSENKNMLESINK
jgi:hypothetical protein